LKRLSEAGSSGKREGNLAFAPNQLADDLRTEGSTHLIQESLFGGRKKRRWREKVCEGGCLDRTHDVGIKLIENSRGMGKREGKKLPGKGLGGRLQRGRGTTGGSVSGEGGIETRGES